MEIRLITQHSKGGNNMSLIAPVKDGEIASTSITTTKEDTTGSSTLGKDAFLQLLVAQMKYQDPLNPSSDTEWISQMAQFSSLEQMQNMNSTITNSQAFSMIGQTVEITADDKIVEGVVDYVTVSSGKAYVSVNGESYEADKVTSVLSPQYLQQINGPQVPKQTVTYDYDNRTSTKISVSLGKDGYSASGMYVAINGKLIDSSHLSFDEDKNILTIDKDAFYGLNTGKSYDLSFLFDDAAATTITGQVTVKVIGNQPADAVIPKEDSANTEQNGDSTESV